MAGVQPIPLRIGLGVLVARRLPAERQVRDVGILRVEISFRRA